MPFPPIPPEALDDPLAWLKSESYEWQLDSGAICADLNMNGLCRCGCGKSTKIADKTINAYGWVKGQPKPYVHGHNTAQQRPTNPPINDDPLIRFVPLTNNQWAKVDADKYSLLMSIRWSAHWAKGTKSFYANHIRRVGSGKLSKTETVAMSRFLLPCPKGLVIDHINRNTLDNRLCNLRVASYRHNQRNSKVSSLSKSGVSGVVQTADGQWRATIGTGKTRCDLGLHVHFEDACRARRTAEIIIYGESKVQL